MEKTYQTIIVVIFACLIAWVVLGCQMRSQKPAENEQATDSELLNSCEHNVEIIQAVEGYCEADGIALSDALERLADKAVIKSTRITAAKDYEGQYLHILTEDEAEYYVRFMRNKEQTRSFVWEIYKGPIENRESIWMAIE